MSTPGQPPAPLPQLAAYGWSVNDVAEAHGGVWVARGAGASVDYPDDSHALLAAIENDSAWFGERNRLLSAALSKEGLPKTLIEVGAGNGFVAAHLRGLGVDAIAVEPGREAAMVAAGRGVPTICGMFEDLALPDSSVEAVGVFDVLEHVADPAALLAEIRRVLIPAGRLAITVPAMPMLWSQADVLAGHHRRYRRGGLVADLDAAGFVTESCSHVFGVIVPAVGLLRALPYRLGRRRSDEQVSDVATRQVAGYGEVGRVLERGAFAAERALRRVVDLPVGTSLLGVFKVRPPESDFRPR